MTACDDSSVSTGDATNEITADEAGWPLSKTLDLVAIVLVSAVVARAIGAILSAVGVPGVHIYLGTSQVAPTVSLPGFDLLPTEERLLYGTAWADLITGVLLLGGLALVVIPRVVWDVSSKEQWLRLIPRFVLGIGVLAGLATVAGVISVVNVIWHSSHIAQLDEASAVAERVAALGLAILAALLAWKALRYVEVETSPEEQESDS